MNQKIITLLEDYGLNTNEIKVYLYLVGENELTAYSIAKNTKIHRSTCYDILERLSGKGFVSKMEKDKKQFYSANELNKIVTGLKEQAETLKSLIPEMKLLEERQETKLRFRDGKNSQKEFDDNLKILGLSGKLTFAYVISNGPTENQSMNLFIERYINEISKLKAIKKLDYRGLWDKKLKNHSFPKLYNKLGPNRFIDGIPTHATTVIYDNHVAFLYRTDTAKVIEIKNKKVSKEIKAYFEIMWKLARP
jgi:predicted transcriptional regulator